MHAEAAFALWALRAILGHEPFLKAYRTYIRQVRYKHPAVTVVEYRLARHEAILGGRWGGFACAPRCARASADVCATSQRPDCVTSPSGG
jgi:hypothetical protein